MNSLGGLPLLLATSIACAAAACASQTGDAGDDSTSDVTAAKAPQVQMNDVSIVLPLPQSQAELDQGYLLPSTVGSGGALIPQDLYLKYSGFPLNPGPVLTGADSTLPYSQLRAVAFRIDPCFANIGPVTNDAACANQLRVVFQAITISNGTASANDSAIHAFYNLSRAELVTLLKDIVAARKANGGSQDLGPLAPHPLVVKQGLLGAENTALRAAILKHAGTKTLSRFTEFASGGTHFFWTFKGFDIANGEATEMVIPTLPANGTTETFSLASNGGAVPYIPASTATDNMQILGNVVTAKAATDAQQKAALDVVFKIENPNFESPNTVDCASCHTTGVAKSFASGLGLAIDANPNGFAPNAQFVPAADTAVTTPFNPNAGLNLHMFSYRDANLNVGQRVINETASVVAYINGSLH
jgi:hypothetical protein